MQIDNPFLMNDWEISKFLKAILSIQVAALCLIGLSQIGIEIPVLVQIFGFVFVTFLPGVVLLRVLRLHRLGMIKTLLYSIGIGLSFQMFLGLIMNAIFPVIQVLEPISTLSMIVATNIALTALCFLSYLRDKNFSAPSSVYLKDTLSFPTIALCALPVLSLLGVFSMNFSDDNILFLFLLPIISMVPILVVFDKIPRKAYPLAIFVIGVSLLFHRSLLTTQLLGWDVHIEYYFSALVKANSYWDLTLAHPYNAMLSVTILASTFSNVCNLSLVWVFKLIYPFLFSLVPLGLYKVFQEHTNDKIAFLSCFFFMASYVFFSAMIQLARQEVASLFLVLLILLMVEKKMNGPTRSGLFVIFGFSLIVSHYALSLVYIFSLVSVMLMLAILNNTSIQKLRIAFRSFRKYDNNNRSRRSRRQGRTIVPIFVLRFVILALVWYIYVSGSVIYESIVEFWDKIVTNVLTGLFDPRSAQGLGLLVTEAASPLHEINRILYLTFGFCIVIGVFASILGFVHHKFSKEYLGFAVANLIVALASIAVPYFSSPLGSDRLYHIALFVLAPFCVLGFLAFFESLRKVATKRNGGGFEGSSLKILAILLAGFLLFNSGFVYELVNDNPTSISLNNTIDYPRFSNAEVQGAKWIANISGNSFVYGDTYGRLLLYEYAFWRVKIFWGQTGELPQNAYVYLRSLNVKGTVMESEETYPYTYMYLADSTFFNETLIKKNKVYDNGYAQIYR